jgi:hypothetical protein
MNESTKSNKRKKVVSRKNQPTRLPLWQSLTCWLALEYSKAPEWLYGAAGFFFLVAWLAWILSFFREEEVDILADFFSNE